MKPPSEMTVVSDAEPPEESDEALERGAGVEREEEWLLGIKREGGCACVWVCADEDPVPSERPFVLREEFEMESEETDTSKGVSAFSPEPR